MNATLAGVMSELQILIITTEDIVRLSNYCRGSPTKLMVHKWVNEYIYIYISVYKIDK
jgi:hypothetical protein